MIGKMHKMRAKVLAKALTAVVAVGVGQSAFGQVVKPVGQFFDWSVPTEAGGADFTPSPFLSDTNFASVDAFLAARAANPANILAVKVNTTLTSAGAKAIFNKYKISYVFADYESTTALSRTQALVSIVKSSTKSSSASIGDFSLAPMKNDTTRPGALGSTTPTAGGGHSLFSIAQYQTSKVNMANPALYPGAPDFRNPAQGNSNAVNIRSALFVLPITRLSLVRMAIPNQGGDKTKPVQQIIPWVSRFNNWGNPALDSDGNSGNGFQFVQNAATPSNGQLLSRGDFEAQILHYRMRGAHSLNLFNYSVPNSSVVGYSSSQERDDAVAGWNQSAASAVFNRGHYTFANMQSTVSVNPLATKNSEQIGTIYSGVYDTAGSARQLVILLSNLGTVDQTIDIPKIGGIPTFETTVPGKGNNDYTIESGRHRVLTFNLTGGKWVLANNSLVFTDNNRNGIGVPEPTSIGLLAAGGFGLLLRRKRR